MYDALSRLADAAGLDAQPMGNLGGFVALKYEVEHLAFAGREALGQFVDGLSQVVLLAGYEEVVVEREERFAAATEEMGEDPAATVFDPLALLPRGVGGVEQGHAFPQVDEDGLHQLGTQHGIAIRSFPAKVADGFQVCSHEEFVSLLFVGTGHGGEKKSIYII